MYRAAAALFLLPTGMVFADSLADIDHVVLFMQGEYTGGWRSANDLAGGPC